MSEIERIDVDRILDRIGPASPEENGTRRTLFVRTGVPSPHRTEGAVRLLVDILNTLDGVVWEARSADRAFSFLSPRSGTLLGYAVREWLENPSFWLEHLHPDDRERAVAESRTATASPEVREIEYRIRSSAGDWIWLRDRFHGFGGPQESGIVLRGLVCDITSTKRVEIERGLLEAAVEQTHDSLLITDTAGTITWVNPAFERLSGYMREEIVGRHTRILKSGRHPESFYRELWETVLRGDVWRGRMTNRRRDGTLFEEEETITPVRDTSGRTTHFVCVRREVGLPEKNGAEPSREESLALAPIVASLAGELNNHLSTVNLSLALLRRTFPFPPGGTSEPLERASAAVRDASRSLSRLVRASRPRSAPPAVSDLRRLIAQSLDALGRMLDPRIAIETDLPPEPLPAAVDPNDVGQILFDLLIRARDALPDGGTIQVRLSPVEAGGAGRGLPSELAEGRWYRLEFRDSGSGLGSEGPHPETGLAVDAKAEGHRLASVRSLVARSGGAMRVAASPRQGTTITIYLPAAPEAPLGARTSSKATGTANRTILVVDEDGPAREALAALLRAEEFRVLAAADADAARSILAGGAGPVDAVVLDRASRGRDGEPAVDDLLSLAGSIPVVVSTGDSDPADARELLGRGAAALLAKPIDPDELVRLLRRALAVGGAG